MKETSSNLSSFKKAENTKHKILSMIPQLSIKRTNTQLKAGGSFTMKYIEEDSSENLIGNLIAANSNTELSIQQQKYSLSHFKEVKSLLKQSKSFLPLKKLDSRNLKYKQPTEPKFNIIPTYEETTINTNSPIRIFGSHSNPRNNQRMNCRHRSDSDLKTLNLFPEFSSKKSKVAMQNSRKSLHQKKRKSSIKEKNQSSSKIIQDPKEERESFYINEDIKHHLRDAENFEQNPTSFILRNLKHAEKTLVFNKKKEMHEEIERLEDILENLKTYVT
jgi:hypothetical protein